jgi:acyl-coenzyme A thioesterase PaaI-like protein
MAEQRFPVAALGQGEAGVAPAIGAHLDATATVRRAGKTVAVVDIDVFNPDGKLVAIGRGTYSPIAG